MGFLSKQGHRLRAWKQRWYVALGNCIYYYQHKQDKFPRGVVFLTGSFVEPLREEVLPTFHSTLSVVAELACMHTHHMHCYKLH
jgi:PH domain